MSKADSLGGSATFDAVAQPMSSRAASFAAFSGQAPAPSAAGDSSPHTPRVPVGSLTPNPYNPRVTFAAIEEMADSLASKGVIQPLTVVTCEAFLAAHPDHAEDLTSAEFVVVDGNRRLAGAKLAGLDDVPVYVDDALAHDADTLLETALTAAVQHEDLEPLDEAKALERLVEVHGSQRAVARALGKSSGWVTQRLALLKLTPELKKALEDKTLPVKVARTVGQLPEQQQQSAAEEALVQRAKQKSESARKPRSAYPVSTPTASTAIAPQSKAASPPDGTAPEENLMALATDLKRRLTPQQVEELAELLLS
ncbi:ParB/RepB/Spo0J family partition protein [Streptomyces scabiei]|uniref:ParB/RepB/Spo0J family partition protein n=1 Tax=Streptomyces scabiei TaxID=1930 RepID=UPI0029AAB0E3|nr:ParB/RepB/Spo0J family partition protein [Streptomyces scabiei]MDX3209482.1 ParB/RepB/Spo0J family partition protein [Streptomyces scabiei]